MRILRSALVLAMCMMLLAGPAFAVDKPAPWKDVKFELEGDYQAYGKYFSERDLNKYDGNQDGQTDKTEAWLEHELRLKPAIIFNDKLEFHSRIDVGPYIFTSDHSDRLDIQTDSEGNVTEAKQDNEKPRVEDCFVQMITPVGLFVVGRFEAGSNGIVWGVQVPQLPGWTFALAWNKKDEEKQNYETPDYAYTNPFVQNLDYLDRDDMDEVRALTIYESADKALTSQQWLDFRIGGSHAVGQNMLICLPQWKVIYDKGNVHYKHGLGTGLGMLAELTKMPAGDDLRTLMETGVTLNSLQPGYYDFPVVPVRNLGPTEGKAFFATMLFAYDMDKITPDVGFFYATGGSKYYEVDGFLWDEYEPQGYRTPRWYSSLLIGEFEDKYYPLLANLATANAVNQNDICFHNMTFLKAGATYRPTSKWEINGQVLSAWRTNTEYFKQDYWDMFPIMYALANQRVNATNGHTEVPFVFKTTDTQYYEDVSNYLGLEIDGRVTYKLFDGLDISLLGAYFKTGDFYKDVLTPKPYMVQWVDANTQDSLGSAFTLLGPNVSADEFDKSDAWTVQLKVDFKFKL